MKPKRENGTASGLFSSEEHWASVKLVDNMLMDALTKHVLGLTQFAMADIGEVFEALCHVEVDNEESWVQAWVTMALVLETRAEEAEKSGKTVSAASEYLRASTYWRVALMYFSASDDPRMARYTQKSVDCYERYLKLSGYPGEAVEIPYEHTTLPGHFYRSPAVEKQAPLLIITPGRDTWAEDTRWVSDSAIRRGIHCLVFDGPGQGVTLRTRKLPFRPDWENVIGPVIDFAERLPGIATGRIALMGMSFGGFLVPRAAAFDKRIKLCIADPGSMNWGEGIIQNLQKAVHVPAGMLPPQVRSLVSDYAWKHGVRNTVQDVIEELKAYDNTDIINRITCETLVLDGAAEILPGRAKEFYDALTCPKHYLLFDETTTAQSHTQMGGYAPAAEMLFDWVEDHL